MSIAPAYDLAIIGGGINGCGIARDAAGRGLSVFLCEQGDLASGTSSASTKLIHGGLRYLEYYEFRLVREALREREILLRAAPHIIWPLRFILPHHEGLRPAWLIRFGLFCYDHLGGRRLLPGTSIIDLKTDEAGSCLRGNYSKAFEYSDCWVMDSRLVVLNAIDAREKGAEIQSRCRCIGAARHKNIWRVETADTDNGRKQTINARVLVNATGPWLDKTLTTIEHRESTDHIRMVKGSHIIVKKLFNHDRAYIFQNEDGRIIFAIPYQNDFTLIGTTDVDFIGDPANAAISEAETSYLCTAASEYFARSLDRRDIISDFSGIRPLFDDGRPDAKAATRDYVLRLDASTGAPLLSIYGGKITTYRKLAQSVLEKLSPYLPKMKEKWTAAAHLPGGNFHPEDFDSEVNRLRADHPFFSEQLAFRLVRLYGTVSHSICRELHKETDLGRDFGHSLHEFEVHHLTGAEWAKGAEDILWRRTQLGLYFSSTQVSALQAWLEGQQ